MPIAVHRVDGPLGRWTHTEWRPGPGSALADVVERVWHFDGAVAAARERVFPDGTTDIVVHLDGRYHVVSEGGEERCPVVNVGGAQTAAYLVVAPPGTSRALGVRLRPGGAWRVLALPACEVRGLALDLRDLVGRAGEELATRCHDAPDAAACVRAAVAWLAERVARSPGIDPAVAWAVGALQQGAPSVRAVRERLGVARRRFTDTFREQVGLAPKAFARVARFQRALAALRAGAGLSETALAAGYYDPPHMNADFRELAGMTPGELRAAVTFPNSVSVAEDGGERAR